MLAVFVHRLLGHLPNGNTYFSNISSRSCNSVMHHFHIITVFQFFQHSLGRLLESDTPAYACVPSRPTGLLPPWMKANFAAATAFSVSSRSTAELPPLLSDTQYHPTRFAHSLAVHRFSPDSPTIIFCLPRSGPVSLMGRSAGKYCCLLLSSTSGCTLERSLGFLAPSSAPRPWLSCERK